MKEFKKYYDYIDKLINDTPDFMLINDDESYVLLDRLVVDLSENAMTWLFKVYLDQNYNILKEDNLTDYIKDKYKDINLKVKNENGNVFLNKDVIYVILKELEENNQVVYENEKFNLNNYFQIICFLILPCLFIPYLYHLHFSHSSSIFRITTSLKGRQLSSVSCSAIESTISIPSITSPKTVYSPSKWGLPPMVV